MSAIRRTPAWIVALIGGLGVCIAYRAYPDPVFQAGVFIGIGLLGTAAIAMARVGRTLRRSPWLLALGCLAAWAFVGNPFWEAGILLDGAPPASFSAADAGFIAGEVMWVAFLATLIRRREPGSGALIEAAIVSVTGAALSWIFLFDHFALDSTIPQAARATQLVYALCDVLLFGMLARLLVTRGRRGTSYWLVVTATTSLLLADLAWNWLIVAGEYRFGSYTDLGWLGFTVFAAAAAIHPSADALVARASRSEASLTAAKVVLLFGAGLAIPVALSAELVVVGHGANATVIVGLVCVGTISALVLARTVDTLRHQARLSRRLSEQNDRLLELDRMKDGFVSSVSHELRTPLTSIRGYVDLIIDGDAGPLTPEQEDFLGIVDRNADRLLRLVADLLFVAQVDAGKLEISPASLDLNAVIDECITAARPHAEAREITVEFDHASLPAVAADRQRIEQVLDNLISNAVKFTPPGGHVVVAAAFAEDKVVIEVRDNGIGIPEVEQARLFERFFRSSTSSDQAIRGTGLGLSIVKAIVEAHGGTVTCTSALGEGTTFVVALPVTTAPAIRLQPLAA